MKRNLLVILAVLMTALLILSGCGEGSGDDTTAGSDPAGTVPGPSDDTTEETDPVTEPPKDLEPLDLSSLIAVGSSGGVYADFAEGSMLLAESDLYMTFDTSASDASYTLMGSYTDANGGVHSAEIWSSAGGINSDAKNTLGITASVDGEFTNAIRIWMYFLELPDDFDSSFTLYGTDKGTETDNFVTYTILDVGEPSGGNITGVYFNTSSDNDNVTVGDTITVTFDMTLSQMYGLKASYDVDGTANYCNIVCFGADYAETPFDGSETYQYFKNYGVFEEDAARLGMTCELEEGENFTVVTFTVVEIKVPSFSFYGCIDASESYGWHTYSMS